MQSCLGLLLTFPFPSLPAEFAWFSISEPFMTKRQSQLIFPSKNKGKCETFEITLLDLFEMKNIFSEGQH